MTADTPLQNPALRIAMGLPRHQSRLMLCLLFCTWFFLSQNARAEPYLAVQQGFKCSVCHTSPSGGGKRNAFGNVFAQRELPAHHLRDAGKRFWTGEVLSFLSVGADVRGSWTRTDVPGQPNISDTDLDELLAYAELRLVPNRLTIHIDARLAPGDPIERELFARLATSDGRFYVRGGQFFLPYGLRLQDDSAFIRQVPGINFNTPDIGWEIGLEQDEWSAQFAVSRGTAGGPEIDSGKQYSLILNYVKSRWRLGGSLNFNDAAAGDRQMQNLFAGVRTGPVAWIAEIDPLIYPGVAPGRRESVVSFLEANFAIRQGHNIKASIEYFDPDREVSEDQQNRFSLVWEYFPVEFVQTRAGFRTSQGIPQNPAQNRDQLFLELHLIF